MAEVDNFEVSAFGIVYIYLGPAKIAFNPTDGSGGGKTRL